MRVKILSGNAVGSITELPDIEAEAALATGYAERASGEPATTAIVDVPPTTVVDDEQPIAPVESTASDEPVTTAIIEEPIAPVVSLDPESGG